MAAFRVLLAAFGVAMFYLAARYVRTGERIYMRRALWLLGGVLLSGVLFFAVLLVSRLS